MKEKLFSNLGFKLLSLVLGFIVWLVVLNIDDSSVTKRINNVPVELINQDVVTDQNKLFTVTDGDTVDIVVKGRKSIISSLSVEDFVATADMSDISIANAVPITVKAKRESVNNSISITMLSNMLHVELEDEKTVAISVAVETEGKPADGYAVGNCVATPNLINVRGPESIINSISGASVIVDVSGADSDITTVCNPVLRDVNNNEISMDKIFCDVESIEVTIPICKTKTVPVNVEVSGEVAEGYVISSIEYAPEKLNIAAVTRVLALVNSVNIDDINVDGLTSSYEETVEISKYLPEGVVVADKVDAINIKINIEKRVEKAVNVSPEDIAITNKTDNYYYEITMDKERSVTVSGVASVIYGIDASALNISVDGAELSLGENRVTLEVLDGDDYKVVSTCDVTIVVSAMP